MSPCGWEFMWAVKVPLGIHSNTICQGIIATPKIEQRLDVSVSSRQPLLRKKPDKISALMGRAIILGISHIADELFRPFVLLFGL